LPAVILGEPQRGTQSFERERTMRASQPESIQYLSPSGQVETATQFEAVSTGILIPVGAASEIMIPWARVLMYMGPRGKFRSYL
jgi:hypothetical protein